MVNRNDPCPCGSGKKYKKCCISKIPREQGIYIGYREPFNGIIHKDGEIFIKLSTGEITKPDAMFSQQQYMGRSGKEKAVYCIPDKYVINIADLLSSFDLFYAIDTNTKSVNGRKVSITCILACHFKLLGKINENQVEYRIRQQDFYFAFKNCADVSEEKLAWFKLIKLLSSDQTFQNKRICIITDHDLEGLRKYNNQESPIIYDYYLPKNINLIYASADKENDSIINKLIAYCEKKAKKILNNLEKNGTVKIGDKILSLNDIPEA